MSDLVVAQTWEAFEAERNDLIAAGNFAATDADQGFAEGALAAFAWLFDVGPRPSTQVEVEE
jgi:hypothetical protein